MSRARLAGTGAALLAALAICPPPAHALRVVTWNMFAYPDYNLAARQPYFRTVMANIAADVLIVQELNSGAGRDSFLTNVLNVVEPGQWASSAFFTLQSIPSVEGGAVFYKPAKDGSPTLWHQDNMYWKYEPPNLASIWIALDDVNHQEDHTQGQPHGEQSEQMMKHQKTDYDRETAEFA